MGRSWNYITNSDLTSDSDILQQQIHSNIETEIQTLRDYTLDGQFWSGWPITTSHLIDCVSLVQTQFQTALYSVANSLTHLDQNSDAKGLYHRWSILKWMTNPLIMMVVDANTKVLLQRKDTKAFICTIWAPRLKLNLILYLISHWLSEIWS